MTSTSLHVSVAHSPCTPGFPHLGLSKLVLSSSRYPHTSADWVKTGAKAHLLYFIWDVSTNQSTHRAWRLIHYCLAQSHCPEVHAWVMILAPTRSKPTDYIHWKDLAEWDHLQCEGNRNSFKSMTQSHLDITCPEKGFPLPSLVKPPTRWVHRHGVQFCSPFYSRPALSFRMIQKGTPNTQVFIAVVTEC